MLQLLGYPQVRGLDSFFAAGKLFGSDQDDGFYWLVKDRL